MSAYILTEEPKDMEDQHGNMNKQVPGHANSSEEFSKDHLHSKTWSEEDWTKAILEMYRLSSST